jgi:hypothetical protein
MIKQTWNINEDEKNRILNLHESATKNLYLIAEQLVSKNVQGDQKDLKFPTQNIGNKFGFGEYDSQNVKQSILNLKPKIEEFIKTSGGNKFEVNITSGESNVTNPKGFETKGSLGLARANSVKRYFEEIFPDLIEQGILTINHPKSESEVTIGKTPYDKTKGDNKNPELVKKYREEQFVKFDISVGGESCNFNFSVKAGQGDPKLNYVLTNEFLKGKGVMTFGPGQIPDRLIVIDGKGQIESDTGYITSETSKYKDWKYTPAYVLSLTKLKNSNSVAVSGGKIETITATNFNELLSQLLNDPNSKNYRKSGDEIGPALSELKMMVNKGQTEFVIYNLSSSVIKIPFDSPSNDKKVKVFSPIAKEGSFTTGYELTGACTT